MADYSFQIEGLDELFNDVNSMYKEYPEDMSNTIYKISGEFTKDVNDKFPASYKTGKQPLNKNWKRERDRTMFTGYTIRVNVTNKSPHFHLVENGHQGKVPTSDYAMYIKHNGSPGTGSKKPGTAKKGTYAMKDIGFVAGKHYCEKTRYEWVDKYPGQVAKHIERILRRHNL